MRVRESGSESRSVVSDSLQPEKLYNPWNSPGQNTGMGIAFPFLRDVPNPGIKPRSPTLQADALTSAPPGKPLNTRIKGGKEARLKEEGGGGGRGGAEGVALQTSPATCRYPGVMGLYPGPPEKGGLELGPTRNQTRPEPEFKFSAKRR